MAATPAVAHEHHPPDGGAGHVEVLAGPYGFPGGTSIGPGQRIHFSSTFGDARISVLAGDGVRDLMTFEGVGPWDIEVNGPRTAYVHPFALFGVVDRSGGHVLGPVSTAAYEEAANPDQGNVYGPVSPLPPECVSAIEAANVDAEHPFPTAPYQGDVHSNPFGVTEARGGGWFVADAGGNAILHVDRAGGIHLVAVLPAIRTQLNLQELFGEAWAGSGCPAVVDWWAEPVPTGVAQGRDGYLYVSLLAAEAPGAGAVYRVDPRTGATTPWLTGLTGPTDVAFGHPNRMYVAEMFAARVLEVPVEMRGGALQQAGEPRVVLGPQSGFLPVKLDANPPGTLVVSALAMTPEGPGPGYLLRVHLH